MLFIKNNIYLKYNITMSTNNNQSSNGTYHERQIRELCALHTLNNLFQGINKLNKIVFKIIINHILINYFFDRTKLLYQNTIR